MRHRRTIAKLIGSSRQPKVLQIRMPGTAVSIGELAPDPVGRLGLHVKQSCAIRHSAG